VASFEASCSKEIFHLGFLQCKPVPHKSIHRRGSLCLKDEEGRLQCSFHIYLKNLGAEDRRLPVKIFFYQKKYEVQE